jgi:hypothetical protein
VVIIQPEFAAFNQVALERGGGGLMQRYQSAFAELGFPDHQATRGDVFEPQRQGLGDPESRDSE